MSTDNLVEKTRRRFVYDQETLDLLHELNREYAKNLREGKETPKGIVPKPAEAPIQFRGPIADKGGYVHSHKLSQRGLQYTIGSIEHAIHDLGEDAWKEFLRDCGRAKPEMYQTAIKLRKDKGLDDNYHLSNSEHRKQLSTTPEFRMKFDEWRIAYLLGLEEKGLIELTKKKPTPKKN